MKLIEPSVEILEQSSGLDGIYKQIEIAGRTCYKSEENITEDSAKGFVDRMIKSGHGAMLEHGTVYLTYRIDYNSNPLSNGYDENREREVKSFINKYYSNKYSKVNHYNIHYANYIAITTNYRVLVENNWLDDLQYLCEPTEYHEKRITVKFICDRGISHELVRHRVFSFAQESTRYCNYSKDKFGNELTFIIPSWFKTLKEASDEILLQTYSKEQVEKGMNRYYAVDNCENEWIISLLDQEVVYISLIDNGWTPQQARAILPNSLKTEIVMTGFESDWEGFFKLRCDKAAHPDMQVLANKLKGLMNEEK